MKLIKKLLFKSTRNIGSAFLISLIVGIVILLISIFGKNDSNESLEVFFIVLNIFVIYVCLITLVLFIASGSRYLIAINRFKKGIQEDDIYVEDEDFEKLHQRVYISKNYILHTQMSAGFVLHRSWVTSCKEKTIFRGNICVPVIEFIAKNKTYLISYTRNKKDDRDLVMTVLKTKLDASCIDYDNEIKSQENTNHSTINFKEKQGGLNLIGFIAISSVLFLIFGFGYSIIRGNKPNYSKPIISNDDNTNTHEESSIYRAVDFTENGEIELNYEIEDGVTVLYFYNNSDYVFKANATIAFGNDVMEDVETYWIRPQGFDYIDLENVGEPTEYRFNTELYREIITPASIDYLIYPSSLLDTYAYDIVIDGDNSLENVIDIAIDQAIYTEMEELSALTLLVHSMDIDTFMTENPPEDLSTLIYIVEIDVPTQTVVIYEATGDEPKELEKFNYEEKYYER
jgi:hypothetical protein